MTRFDHDALIAQRNIMRLCAHMSAAYLVPILDDAELALISSRCHPDNVVTRSIVAMLFPMAAGAAFQVIREVRAALLPQPVIQTPSLTIYGLREADAGMREWHMLQAAANALGSIEIGSEA